MRVHIWSHFAAEWNDQRAAWEASDPEFAAKLDPARNEVWQGVVPDEFEGCPMDLEGIFRFFNRVDESDGPRLEALGYDLPSLSTGDIVTLDGKQWRVAPVGFNEVEKHVEFRAGGIPGDGWPCTTISD